MVNTRMTLPASSLHSIMNRPPFGEIITLIVCRLIVVKAKPWRSAQGLDQIAIRNGDTRSARGARLLARGVGGTGKPASQLHRWRRAGRAKRGLGKYCEAGAGPFRPYKRPL